MTTAAVAEPTTTETATAVQDLVDSGTGFNTKQLSAAYRRDASPEVPPEPTGKEAAPAATIAAPAATTAAAAVAPSPDDTVPAASAAAAAEAPVVAEPSEIEKLQARIVELEKPAEAAPEPDKNLTMDQQITAATTAESLNDLQQRNEDAKRTIRNILDSDETELPLKPNQPEGGVERFTRAELTDMLNTAEDALSKWIPGQREFNAKKADWDSHREELHPFLADKESEGSKFVAQQLATPIGKMLARSVHNADFFFACLFEGEAAVKARGEAAKAGTDDGKPKNPDELGTILPNAAPAATIPSKPPAGAGGAPASRVESGPAARAAHLNEVDGNLSTRDLAALLLSAPPHE